MKCVEAKDQARHRRAALAAVFNGRGGIWHEAERWPQDDVIVAQDREVWEFAGTIFGPARLDAIGPNGDVEVPPLIYKIVASTVTGSDIPEVLAFLFPHHRAQGEIEEYMVPRRHHRGPDWSRLFSELDDDVEDGDIWQNWGRALSLARVRSVEG